MALAAINTPRCKCVPASSPHALAQCDLLRSRGCGLVERERLCLVGCDVSVALPRLCSVCIEHDVEPGLPSDAAATRAKKVAVLSSNQTSSAGPIGRHPGLSGGPSRFDIDDRAKW